MKWGRAVSGERVAAFGVLLLAILLGVAAAVPASARQDPRENAPSPEAKAAAVALFIDSNLPAARAHAAGALRRNSNDRDSLLVAMEAAALAADSPGVLEAAVRLCGSRGENEDPRLLIAGARILELAGNDGNFRPAIARIQQLLGLSTEKAGRTAPARTAPSTSCTGFLRLSLLQAAAEGVTGLSAPELARDAGVLTDWRLAGPFGRYPNIAFDRVFAPERDQLSQRFYADEDAHAEAATSPAAQLAVEHFRFEDGKVELPDYLSPTGVFYAVSQTAVSASGNYRLRIESGGTLDVFVDGERVIRKDDRWRARPQMASADLRLDGGSHCVLVKFLASAAPFRIALTLTSKDSQGQKSPDILAAGASYVEAAERFWMGDYDGAIRRLRALRGRYPSAAVDLLLAQSWTRAGEDAPEEPELLASALRRSPQAVTAEYRLAERAYNNDRMEEAVQRVRRVLAARPDYAPAQELLANAAVKINLPDEAAQAFTAALRLRPTCDRLRSTARYFSSIAAYERAARIEERLNGCVPGSLAYAEALSAQGRHDEAAAAAQKVVRAYPLHREAHALLAREWASAGKPEQARRAAEELAALAPNSVKFRALSERIAGGIAVADEPSERASGLAAKEDFYSPHRRDGLEFIRKTAHRRFAGGPAVILLKDQVAQLGKNGSVALYVHKITRVLNRDGIEKYGEVTLPEGAALLELRTVKQDGAIVEPEFTPNKNSISMPALAPGDAIEQEYVMHYPAEEIRRNPGAITYVFGSFKAPILYARFVVLRPACASNCASEALKIGSIGSVPAPRVTAAEGMVSRVWEMENIAQSAREVSAPPEGGLPAIRITMARAGGWRDLRDSYRNRLISALRAGPRVEATARELQGATAEATARNFYRLVGTRVHAAGSFWESGGVSDAERTLSSYSGSRTIALLALSRAAGLEAELLLARSLVKPVPPTAEDDVFTHPLVRFRFGSKEVVVDAEAERLGFGEIPATLATDRALLIPLMQAEAQQEGKTVAGYPPELARFLAPIPASAGEEHSFAEGDVTLDAAGNLAARVKVRMGASRSAQMRAILSGIAPAERRHFFERLAARIFAGTAEAYGEVNNEQDAGHPLELILTCRAPHFLAIAHGTAEMDQLVPTLGLSKMYGAGQGSRRLPLYIDTPLVESSVFRVHLPAGVTVGLPSSPVSLNNKFGSYKVEFRQTGAAELEIRRAFRIPVQIVAPEQFQAFARFARQIDYAEQQRIMLEDLGGQATALAPASGPEVARGEN